jgi:hypothetical protein
LLYTVVGIVLGITLHVLQVVAHHINHLNCRRTKRKGKQQGLEASVVVLMARTNLLAGEKVEKAVGGEHHELIGCSGGSAILFLQTFTRFGRTAHAIHTYVPGVILWEMTSGMAVV